LCLGAYFLLNALFVFEAIKKAILKRAVGHKIEILQMKVTNEFIEIAEL